MALHVIGHRFKSDNVQEFFYRYGGNGRHVGFRCQRFLRLGSSPSNDNLQIKKNNDLKINPIKSS